METYIVYLDLETGIHEVHMPRESFAVGTGKISTEIAVFPTPFTPFRLLSALASTDQDIEMVST